MDCILLSSMQIGNWLKRSRHQLAKAGVASYNLDSLVLVEYILLLEKAHILANLNRQLSRRQTTLLNKLLRRRLSREPLAYIIEQKEFYGRPFLVTANTLVPRPESESFIDLFKKLNPQNQTIIDVGCGSGILGITIKLESPSNTVILSDVSAKALKVTVENLKKYSLDCQTIKANLIPKDIDASIIVANLPYVPTDINVQPELQYEPSVALFAKDNGMQLYKQLWDQISKNNSVNLVLTESLALQHQEMEDLANNIGFRLIDSDGLVQVFKRPSS